MRTILITYSDSKYKAQQNRLVEHVKSQNLFDLVIAYGREDIAHDFIEAHREIMMQERGSGYWLFKPFFLIKTLELAADDTIVMYIDSADWITDVGIRTFLINKMAQTDILLTIGGYKNSDYTKRDCFVLMDCDAEAYYNEPQIEAGIIVVRKTENSMKTMREWLQYCCDPRIVTDQPNECGLPNLNGYIDHRHDQAILTNISVRHNLYRSREMRTFVRCNWQPY